MWLYPGFWILKRISCSTSRWFSTTSTPLLRWLISLKWVLNWYHRQKSVFLGNQQDQCAIKMTCLCYISLMYWHHLIWSWPTLLLDHVNLHLTVSQTSIQAKTYRKVELHDTETWLQSWADQETQLALFLWVRAIQLPNLCLYLNHPIWRTAWQNMGSSRCRFRLMKKIISKGLRSSQGKGICDQGRASCSSK